ncbi:hypothetical protein CRV08_12410 [Halarcobacter ebronensis]|uniref:Motility accessory factor n=1 Tax=Halarcobacter ebronensis TaxID=1462615 RepID=A0A4Q0Y9S9_9BACT|nr:6-hydroxymethylpterin diphosphokinase MptE-like protein [Halarcobacter ebronensis]RXJ66625.1 hypothetical protein CRV08_12410 [Halarcobacter ebronensis]
MTEEEAQNFAINTYNENIKYLQNSYPKLFQKLSLFNSGLELGQIKAQFDLHFINGYFDIINVNTSQLFYGNNSFELSQKLVSNIDNTLNHSFQAFINKTCDDKEALDKGLLCDYTVGNAPIVNFVTKNVPEKASFNHINKFIIFGLGLGIHLPLIHKKINAKTYFVVEPNLEFFRLSLFVTNYAQLSKETKLILSIAEDDAAFGNSFDTFYNENFIYNYYFKFFELSDSYIFYKKIIQTKLVSQSFYLYTYNRTFLSLYRTNTYILEKFKTLNISKVNTLEFSKKPILCLAAGPSLQKEIEFVKNNQDKFIIVAIYATLPLLEQNGINPDIITQYDEQDWAVLNTLAKIKDINFFKDSIFIFSSHVNAKLINNFNKENIYIFQAMFELKKAFGTLTSPSIGEITYVLLLLLGAKNIYLLGLDMALGEDGKSHIEGHSGADAYSDLKEEDNSLKEYSLKKNIINIKGNFQEKVKSLPAFKASIDSFAYYTSQFKKQDTKVYNLSNGAYLFDTIPLKSEKIDLENIKEKDLKNLIEKDLDSISEADYSEKDLENITLKISNAKKVIKALDNFFKIKKYSKIKDYENNLITTLQAILFENIDSDLKLILANYCQHNIPSIFHLLNTNDEKKNLSFIHEINKALNIQLNKIVNTYLVSILYSKNESSSLSKKINKLVKEYKIDKTIYCDSFFKELSETGPFEESEISGENSIGVFATNENLDNKNLIEYISNIVNLYNCSLKIFYFFEYQKNKARQLFKNINDKVELIIPNNLENISSKVEVYIDSNESSSVEEVNEILLNKHKNIFNISFNEQAYEKDIKNRIKSIEKIDSTTSLKNSIKENKIAPSTTYYEFCDSLKEEIDIEKLNKTYKKEHIGFFAFEDNLTKEFIDNIFTIHNTFKELKFVAFYFNEKQKEKFQETFKDIIDRFEFIIPKDIYDIASNIEIWAKVGINDKIISVKTTQLLLNSMSNFYINILENLDLKNNHLTYLIKNYYYKAFRRDSVDHYDIETNISQYKKNNIGFIITKESLADKVYMTFIKNLYSIFNDCTFNVFYFDDILDEIKNMFPKNTNYIIPKNLIELISSIEIFISFREKNNFYYTTNLFINCENIYVYEYNKKDINITIENFNEANKNHIFFQEAELFEIDKKSIEQSNGKICNLLFNEFNIKPTKKLISLEDLKIEYIFMALKSQRFKTLMTKVGEITLKRKNNG